MLYEINLSKLYLYFFFLIKKRRMYSPAVRIANWVEDLALDNEKMKVFVSKRQREKLLIQHTRRLFDNLLKDVRLSMNNGFLQFGNCIQLKAVDMPSSPPSAQIQLSKFQRLPPSNNSCSNNHGLVMAGAVHDKHTGTKSSFGNDCSLIASPMLHPCTRNCFVIKSADCDDRTGENVVFGQEFVLQIADSDREPLYVRAEKPLVDDAHGPLEHNPIALSNKNDRYCIWKVLHWNKDMRLETQGEPFPAFKRIVIRHLMSGLNLAVEGTVWQLSIFGSECGMSVHTYVDSSKQETAECGWMFVTNKFNE